MCGPAPPTLFIYLALVVVNVAVYAQILHHGFVNYDDPQYILENPQVMGGLTWQGLRWALSTGYFSNWHPLTWLSHMLDVQLYGLNGGLHHLTNLLLHIVNTLLLFSVLNEMTRGRDADAPLEVRDGRMASAFVAALFAVHPLHVQSVAWVAERKDVLSTLFWLLTIWAYVGYVRRPWLRQYLLVILLFAFGLMAKPMLVTLPFVLLLLDYWPLRRVMFAGSRQPSRESRAIAEGKGAVLTTAMPAHRASAAFADQRPAVPLIVEKLPLLALAFASSLVTLIVQRGGGALSGLDAVSLTLRVQNALVSYVDYIANMLWPVTLAVFYPYPDSIPAWRVTTSIVGLICVTVLVIRGARRYPYLPVGWLWYLVTLVPVIGLVQVGNQSMADRYTYVPLIGLFIMLAWGVRDLASRLPHRRIALAAGAALVISACAFAAYGQVRYWENGVTLWTRTLRVVANNAFVHNNLGLALAAEGRVQEAVLHYLEALRLRPDLAEPHNNLGNILINQGKMAQAVAQYSEALRLNPNFAEAHNNFGIALAAQGKVEEAIAQYSEALRVKPDYAEAQLNLGNALANHGRAHEAIAHYSEALRLHPRFAEAHNNLGVLLRAQGRVAEAIAHYSEALRIKPAYVNAHVNLGKALAIQGRIDEAMAHYAEALRINPENAAARSAVDELIRRTRKQKNRD